METIVLNVQHRDRSKKAKDLRKENLIPAEYYGSGVGNISLQMDYQTFRRIFRKSGTNTVLELNVDEKEKMTVLVHEVIYDPIDDSIEHVDFINVRMDQEIHTNIPLEFVGVAPAVKELGGMLMPHIDNLEVKCLPKDLVHSIQVNIEPLVDFHSHIKVQDVVVPSAITVLNNPEDTVISAIAPRVEEEAAAAPAPAAEGAEAAEGAAPEGEAQSEEQK